jgi:hypothetical protein
MLRYAYEVKSNTPSLCSNTSEFCQKVGCTEREADATLELLKSKNLVVAFRATLDGCTPFVLAAAGDYYVETGKFIPGTEISVSQTNIVGNSGPVNSVVDSKGVSLKSNEGVLSRLFTLLFGWLRS